MRSRASQENACPNPHGIFIKIKTFQHLSLSFPDPFLDNLAETFRLSSSGSQSQEIPEHLSSFCQAETRGGFWGLLGLPLDFLDLRSWKCGDLELIGLCWRRQKWSLKSVFPDLPRSVLGGNLCEQAYVGSCMDCGFSLYRRCWNWKKPYIEKTIYLWNNIYLLFIVLSKLSENEAFLVSGWMQSQVLINLTVPSSKHHRTLTIQTEPLCEQPSLFCYLLANF